MHARPERVERSAPQRRDAVVVREALDRAGLEHGDHHVGGHERDPAVGGQGVVRDPEVTCALVGAGHAQRGDRTPAQDASGVDRLTGGDAREAPAGAGAEVSRALGDHDEVRADDETRREQRAVHRHGLEVTAEGLPGGEARGDPAGGAQACDGAREPGRQRAAVGHHVGDPRRRAARERRGMPGSRDDRGQGGVQVRDDDGQPSQVVGVPQCGVVHGVLLVDAQDQGLQRRVPRLDEVTGAGDGVGRRSVRQCDDHGVPAGPEPARERRDVQQDPITDRGIADQHRVGQGPHLGPRGQDGVLGRAVRPVSGRQPDLDLDGSGPRRASGHHDSCSPRDHPATLPAGDEPPGH